MGAHHKNSDRGIGDTHAERRFRGHAYHVLKSAEIRGNGGTVVVKHTVTLRLRQPEAHPTGSGLIVAQDASFG